MIPNSIFADLASNRPVDWDRAEADVRARRVLPRLPAVDARFVREAMAADPHATQELPAIPAAELMADLDARNRIARELDARLQPRPASEWSETALDRLLADVLKEGGR